MIQVAWYAHERMIEGKFVMYMKNMTKKLISYTGECHNEEVVLYGIQTLIDGAATLLVMIGLGVCLKKIELTLLYVIFTFVLARCTGGYHAKTRVRCMLVTILMYLVAVFLPQYMESRVSILWVSIIDMFCVTVVWLMAPVGHPDKPLGKMVSERNKKIARTFSGGVALGVIVLCINRSLVGFALLVNLIEIVLSMMAGKIYYRLPNRWI